VNSLSRFTPLAKWIAFSLLLAVLLAVGSPVGFLAWVWLQDKTAPRPDPVAGHGDFSHEENVTPAEVLPVSADPATAERQLTELVARANREHRKISISGAKHSMGGHTLYPGGITLDMLPFNRMTVDEPARILTVGAGARWSEVIPFLDRHGLAMAVMQSNNDFSVGGSLSVNCHGWQPDSPPIASTVDSFRLITADGKIVTCSRTENPELFSLALGGYGLFGIILDARLRVVPNEYYHAVSVKLSPADYSASYQSSVENQPDVGLAFGRICIAPSHFLDQALLVSYHRVETPRAVTGTLGPVPSRLLERLIFRGSIGSDYGKNLCWFAENLTGGEAPGLHSRNEIMNEPSDWFADHDAQSTEILHEYFIPPARLADFVRTIRPLLDTYRPDLLNITVRKVKADPDTRLAYARQDMFGLVMYFHQPLGHEADSEMTAFTRSMIDAALSWGGTYYLPYRPAATLSQFHAAYPQADSFFTAKRHYDPNGIFQNEFYKRYGYKSGTP
jgi:FAD/FMN-containing dehydrogenase